MKRLKLDHADWHVTLRGARRLQLFHEEPDFSMFYSLLGECCEESGMGLITDCLMSNHFHLALSGGSKQLTRCMQRLDRAYSGYHNQRYGLSGHAFEQEYYCEPITSSFFLRRVVRYIHLNPVRAGRATRPQDYPWSGYRRMITATPDSLGTEEKRVLGLFDPDLDQSRRAYQAFVERDFYRTIRPPVGRTPAWEIWQEQFTWILEHVVEQEEAIHPLSPERVAVHLGSRAGIPPRAMGRVLGHGDGRQVSEMVRQMADRLEDNPGLRQRIERLGIL